MNSPLNNPLSNCLTIGILFFFALSPSAVLAQEKMDTTNTDTTKLQKNKPLPISKEARAALKEAAAVAAQSKGLKGEARNSALMAGAKAYEAVAARFGSEAGACGRAWFAAAELWRRSQSLKAAAKAYGLAADRDPGRYQERSWLQLAHIERRQTLTGQCQSDRTVVLDCPAPGGHSLVRIGRADHRQVRNQAKAHQVLDRLMCWTVFTEPDAIACEYKYGRNVHER